MKKWITAQKYFFKEYGLFNIIFSVIAANWLIKYGRESYIFIFWIKVIGYFATILFFLWNRKKCLYFFHNLGFSFKNLLITSLIFDGIFTLVILSLANIFKM